MRYIAVLGLLLLTSACTRTTGAGSRSGVGVAIAGSTLRCPVLVVGGEPKRVCIPRAGDPKTPSEPEDSTRADTLSRVTVAGGD